MSNETLKNLADDLSFKLPKSFKMFKQHFPINADIHNKITTLYMIKEHNIINMTTLSQHSGIRKSNMTSTINNLVIEGYVTRINDDNDRRTIYLKLTEAGEEYLASRFSCLQEKMVELLSTLSTEDQIVLSESVSNIVNLLGKIENK